MRSSTLACDTPPRLILRTPESGAPDLRYRGDLADDLSSPAGLHRRPWLARLRRALQEDLFAVHYQPIVSLADGRPAHYEALVRLADEPGPLIAPGRFLPAAERYGLVRDIDRLVLARVAALLGSRPEGPRVAINLSALSVTDPAMLTHVERCLRDQGADPGRLVVEITETAAISDMDRARAFCQGLAALGCDVALDDFGAGYGSFHYLTRLPFDYLKIDGSFVRELTVSRNDQLVVQALVGLARGMGVRTIAEYVTDRPTLELLRRYGVDYAQGFELGCPHPRFPL
ncbi:MAG TPA: EAL domain-containing protein [Solirubrobacteraceae bacterium]|jgi:EAL domain-containing protein (putative c-di-GMP-specific phosphodiesterase class I)|nr:EAL domain-containing protein [Solirubrobacteraceae bacterium]